MLPPQSRIRRQHRKSCADARNFLVLAIILNDEGSLLYAQTAPTCLSRAVCFGKGSARPAAIASCEMP